MKRGWILGAALLVTLLFPIVSHAAVEANVRHTITGLLATPEAKARVALGRMKLVEAVYELQSGRVRFLHPK